MLNIPFSSGQVCNAQYMCTSQAGCDACYVLNCNTCYQANFFVESLFDTYKMQSIQVTCPAVGDLFVQGYSDNSCNAVQYNSSLSNACDTCFQVNPLLVAFQLNGKEIWYHGYSNGTSRLTGSVELERSVLRRMHYNEIKPYVD